jgi:hypothetical protein
LWRTCVYASASLLLARELILNPIQREQPWTTRAVEGSKVE